MEIQIKHNLMLENAQNVWRFIYIHKGDMKRERERGKNRPCNCSLWLWNSCRRYIQFFFLYSLACATMTGLCPRSLSDKYKNSVRCIYAFVYMREQMFCATRGPFFPELRLCFMCVRARALVCVYGSCVCVFVSVTQTRIESKSKGGFFERSSAIAHNIIIKYV